MNPEGLSEAKYAMRIIIPVGEQIFCSWLFQGKRIDVGIKLVSFMQHKDIKILQIGIIKITIKSIQTELLKPALQTNSLI